jgi:glutamine synthetase adenylyltransferase
MIEAEFLIQTLQMRSKLWQTNWSDAVAALAAAGQLSSAEASELKQAYDFLRQCESVLRRYENTSVSALPAELNQQVLLSRRLGAATLEAFKHDYDQARSTIHRIYLQRMKARPLG